MGYGNLNQLCYGIPRRTADSRSHEDWCSYRESQPTAQGNNTSRPTRLMVNCGTNHRYVEILYNCPLGSHIWIYLPVWFFIIVIMMMCYGCLNKYRKSKNCLATPYASLTYFFTGPGYTCSESHQSSFICSLFICWQISWHLPNRWHLYQLLFSFLTLDCARSFPDKTPMSLTCCQ